MPSPFASIAVNDAPAPQAVPRDWAAIKAEIVGRLDLRAEFAALGVEFTGNPGTEAGSWECHALGRKDDRPSAVVFPSGIYKDSGSGEKGVHLIEFAAKHGKLGAWKDCLKHYAEKAGVAIGTIKVKSGGRVGDKEYDYHDAGGQVVYRVFRSILPNGEKTFTQRPIDRGGNVVFDKGAMARITPVPYRLPHFPDPERGEWLWITEGEKACEEIVSQGLAATTIHGGTGNAAKAWPIVAAYFKGLDVVYLPDNDKPGRAAAEIACHALAGVAASVRRLDLPGLPARGDVVEWIAAGGTIEQLETLAEACPLWEPVASAEAEADDPTCRDATLADLRLTLAADAWIWTGWIAQGALCLFAAEAGTGKTRTLMDLHRRAYYGLTWPDGEFRPTLDQPKVLWILADGQHQQVCDTAAEFGIPDECIILNTMASDPHGGTSLETPEQLADFEERIERVKPVWVVIDTITNTGDFKSHDSVDAKRQYKPLQEIASRRHVPIIPVTHLNAAGKALGKRVVEKVRTVVMLTQPDPEGQVNRRRLWVDKSFTVKPAPLGVTFGTDGHEYDDKPPVAPDGAEVGATRKGPPSVALTSCMKWLEEHIGPAALRIPAVIDAAEAAGHTKSTVFRAAERLGLVKRESPTGRGSVWSMLPDPETA